MSIPDSNSCSKWCMVERSRKTDTVERPFQKAPLTVRERIVQFQVVVDESMDVFLQHLALDT